MHTPSKPAATSPNSTPAEAWSYWLELFASAQQRRGLKASGIKLHLRNLERFAQWVHPHRPSDVRDGDVVRWLTQERISPTTWRTRRAAVRSFYAWAVNDGHARANPTLGVPSLPKGTGRDALPTPQRGKGPARQTVPVGWASAIADYDRHLVIQAKPATTRETRRQHLALLARTLDAAPWATTANDLELWLASPGLARETLRSRRATVRDFYAWAVRAGHLHDSPAADLPTIASRPGLPRPIPDLVLTNALRAADPRQRLILQLAANAGLRRAEIARLHTRDLEPSGVGHDIRVHGKGDRERLVPLPTQLAADLFNLPEGYIFPTRTGGHLDARAIAKMVAPVLPVPYTLHTLRHRFATQAYRLTRDIYTVQHLLGHSSPSVTQRYVALDTTSLRAAVDAVAALGVA